jgi:hypothetical protein
MEMDVRLLMFWVRQANKIANRRVKEIAVAVRAGMGASKDEWRRFIFELDNPTLAKDGESAADITWDSLKSMKRG